MYLSVVEQYKYAVLLILFNAAISLLQSSTGFQHLMIQLLQFRIVPSLAGLIHQSHYLLLLFLPLNVALTYYNLHAAYILSSCILCLLAVVISGRAHIRSRAMGLDIFHLSSLCKFTNQSITDTLLCSILNVPQKQQQSSTTQIRYRIMAKYQSECPAPLSLAKSHFPFPSLQP